MPPKTSTKGQHVQGNGRESFLAACEAGLEGIVGKKADSVYSGARNGDWIKLKCDQRQEFVIGGFALSDRKTSEVSSLLLGVYAGGKVVGKGVCVKMARGQMVRFMAENVVEDLAEIKEFNRLGFVYKGELSENSTFVFVKIIKVKNCI